MQPYGINLIGDLAGTVVVWLLFLLSGGARQRSGWILLVVCAAASAVGSISVLAQASARADAGVAAYHTMWIIVSVAVGAVAWRRQKTLARHRRREWLL